MESNPYEPPGDSSHEYSDKLKQWQQKSENRRAKARTTMQFVGIVLGASFVVLLMLASLVIALFMACVVLVQSGTGSH